MKRIAALVALFLALALVFVTNADGKRRHVTYCFAGNVAYKCVPSNWHVIR